MSEIYEEGHKDTVERKLRIVSHVATKAMSLDTVNRVVLLLDESPLSEDLEGWLGQVDFREDVDVEVHVTRGRDIHRPALMWIGGDEAHYLSGRAEAAFYVYGTLLDDGKLLRGHLTFIKRVFK